MYFRSLQILRGLAALAVVMYHTHEFMKQIGDNPATYFRFFDVRFSYGAYFFFCLSGFLMAYLIDSGYPRFLLRRFIRIYPTFWLAAVCCIVLKVTIFGRVRNPGFARALSLFPWVSGVAYPLGVEWTLIYEVFFYLVCSVFALGGMRRRLPAFLGLWSLTIVVAHLTFGTRTLMLARLHQLPLSLFNLLFIAGALGYYIFRRVERSTPSVLATCALAAVVSLGGASYCVGELGRFGFLSVGYTAIILMGSIRDRGLRGPSRQSPMERLGDYSYGLYLIHVPVITIVLTLARHSFQWRCGGMIGTFAAGFALVAGWYFGKADLLLHNRLKRMVLGLQRDPTSQPTLPAPLGRKVRAIATMNR